MRVIGIVARTIAMFAVLLFGIIGPVLATDFSSSNFILRDPVMVIEAGESTSTSFRLISSTGQANTGSNSSATFTSLIGFEYFAQGTTPVVTATAGDAEVDLSWTSSVGTFGNVTSYQVGTSTTSGGPYTFESVGNVLSFTKTGLTNGTQYFFKVRAMASSEVVALSAQSTATPTAATPAPSQGNGSGGNNPATPETSFTIFGQAMPSATITILIDGFVTGTTLADASGVFTATTGNITAGTRLVGIYAQDSDGRRTATVSLPAVAVSLRNTTVGSILLSPTLTANNAVVKRGTSMLFSGQAAPGAEVVVTVYDDDGTSVSTQQTVASGDGRYNTTFTTNDLAEDEYSVNATQTHNNQRSEKSQTYFFRVGQETVPTEEFACPAFGDLNRDCRVNLIDFSIAAFWYGKKLSPEFAEYERSRLNNDGVVNIIDFSIMAYYWTG